MKINVELSNGMVRVGERNASLLSGTFHYWRVHPEAWPKALDSIREMGLETIETYIPWQFHELEPGKYDFTGETDSRRDLVKFLKLVKEAGFWLLIRPGPYIYSEWVNMGVPDDVLSYHRLHPYFKQRAAQWIQAVSRELLPYLASNGGNIIMLQPDNEPDTFEQAYLEQLGLGSTPGMFQDFLKERYQGKIEQLNEKWQSQYASFDEAHALMAESDLLESHRRRYMDFIAFRAGYINEIIGYYGQQFREQGMDIPMYANAYDITNVQDFRALEETIGLVGMDSYPPNEFTGRYSPKGEDFKHRRLNEVWRSLRTFSKCAYLAEYQGGNAHGLHYWVGVLKPNHFVMAGLTAIQAGIQAWNWFMLLNHDNFMMCPINEWGRKQGELFRAFAEVVRLYNEAKVPQLTRVTNINALFDTKYQYFNDAMDDPMLSALYQAGIDYEFFNLETERIKKPVMFYSAGRWMDGKAQRKLLDYVEQGGTLVFFRTLPVYDEDNQTPCNELGLVAPDCGMDAPFLDHLASELKVSLDGSDVLTKSPFLYYEAATPGQPIYAHCVDSTRVWDTAFEENRQIRSLVFQKRYTVGYVEQRGKGRIVVLSLRPTPELLRGVLDMLKVDVSVEVQMPQVKHALFSGPAAHELVLINTGDQDIISQVRLSKALFPAGSFHLRNLRQGEDYGMTVNEQEESEFYIRLPRKDGTIIEIIPGNE
jgi:beta-galactosidase